MVLASVEGAKVAAKAKGSAGGGSPHEGLIREGLAKEAKIRRREVAARRARDDSVAATWEFADWLVVNTVVLTPSEAQALRCGAPVRGLTCTEYARWSGYSKQVLSQYRRTAAAFPVDRRAGASIHVASGVLRGCKGDVDAALDALPEQAAAAAAGRSPETQARHLLNGAATQAERVGVQSFADAVGRLKTMATFGRPVPEFVAGKEKWTDEEWEELTRWVAGIDAILAELPVDRPRRKVFRWLRAAA